MKSILYKLSILALFLTSFSSARADIYIWVNGTVFCPAPVNIELSVNVFRADTFAPTDSVEVYMNFADGSDTTFKLQIESDSGWAYAYTYIYHLYSLTGNLPVFCTATWPDAVMDTLYTNVVVSNACGDIEGKVYRDENSNCTYDSSVDLIFPVIVEARIPNSSFVAYDYVDSNGDYDIVSVPTGQTYEVSIYNWYFGIVTSNVLCPASGSYTVTSIPSTGNDFAVTCDGFNFLPYVSGWKFRPADTGWVYTSAYNMGCSATIANVQVNLGDTNLDSLLGTYSAWNITSQNLAGGMLNYATNATSIWLPNSYNGIYAQVTTDSTAQLGDSVCVTTTVNPVTGDYYPANNASTNCWEIKNSWDPNYKEVVPTGRALLGRVRPNLTMIYTIHFQNNGNDTAYNIHVLDTVDYTKLNTRSVKILDSSHPMTLDILGDSSHVFNFVFDNIYLPDSTTNPEASQGYVVYAIDQKPGLPHGTIFTGKADIYFDHNPAVVTNYTVNTIDTGVQMVFGPDPDTTVAVGKMPVDNSIHLYPNPANDVLFAEFDHQSKALFISNLQGQVVRNSLGMVPGKSRVIIPVADLPAGTYMIISVDHQGQPHAQRFVKH